MQDTYYISLPSVAAIIIVELLFKLTFSSQV
nr:MAG TPA: hypothetical protein [Bacteriophage sp.]